MLRAVKSVVELTMTIQEITLPDQMEIEELNRLAAAFFAARHKIEITYFDKLIDPKTYEVAGTLDSDAYRKALEAVLDFAESDKTVCFFEAPTESDPFYQASQPIFGYLEFECRRRLRAPIFKGDPL